MRSPLGAVACALALGPTRRRIAANTLWLGADRLLRLCVGLPVTVLLARYLGATEFGVYSQALALAMLLLPFAQLGLERIVVRDLVERPETSGAVLGSALFLRSLGAGAAFLAWAVLALLWSGEPSVPGLVLPLVAAYVFQAFDVIDHLFASRTLSSRPAIARSLAFIIASGARLCFIALGMTLFAFALTHLLEAALAAVGLAVAYAVSRRPVEGGWRVERHVVRRLFKDSWPLLFSGLMIAVHMRIDQIMLGAMLGDREVGVYSTAVRLTEVWYVLPIIIVSSAFPSIVEVRQRDPALFERRLRTLYRSLALLGYAVALPATLASDWVVLLLFGEEYREAGPMLAGLIWTTVIVNLGIARTSYIAAMNRAGLHLATSALGAVVNVALNLLLIPSYGGMGAVIGSLIAYWVQVHGSCFLFPALRANGWWLTRAMLLLPEKAEAAPPK